MADTATTGRGPGRPAQISREQIVDAAISAGNLDRLTMRELAASLGVRHGALYRWVKNRDELLDLISEVMIERVLPPAGPDGDWRPWLARVAWAMHDQFLAVSGYATRLSRPHQHNFDALGRIRAEVISAFEGAGVRPELAEQSWFIFISSVVSWLAVQEHPLDLGPSAPRFELFLDVLLRGLPAREPGTLRPLGLPSKGLSRQARQISDHRPGIFCVHWSLIVSVPRCDRAPGVTRQLRRKP
jgi:AcrR family transcriptional regulator